MNYKAFTEFLNHSRESKELLGTSSLLRDQTGDRLQTNGGYMGHGDKNRIGNENAKVFQTTSPDTNEGYNMDSQRNGPNSWMACSKTLQSLLEQYLSEPGALSSFKQLFDKNNLQVKDSDVREESQEHVTSQAPPPLLHRPTKRSLEQSHVTVTSPDPKRSRPEDYCAYAEQNPARVTNETSYVREEMFEKTRSLGNSLKPLGPPPPLLKQPPVEKHELEVRWGNLQKHYTKDKTPDPSVEWMASGNKGGCKSSTASVESVSRNARTPAQHFQQVESLKTKPASPLSNGKQNLLPVEPVPRQIESPDKSSCGGYAFDHMAMPKIVAVHSVSKGSEDEDEWAKNKAFISQAKANQSKLLHSSTPAKQQEINHLQSRSVTAQNRGNFVQGTLRYQEANPATFANVSKSPSEEISFERFVLYHLLSKFQGNVEQVKRVLKQNLLQEWLAYSQGNVDPRQLSFNGVNFNELRKLYEIWSQLQRKPRANTIQRNSAQMISNAQNCNRSRVNTGFERNQQVHLSNSQSSPNSQHPRAAFHPQGSYSAHNASSLNQGVHRTSVNYSQSFHSLQQANSGVIEGAARGESSKNIPMNVQEKIHALSQNSTRWANRPDPTPASHIHPQSSTNQRLAYSENQATLSLRSDMCNVKRLHGDQVKVTDFRRAQNNQENIARNQYETYGHTPQRNVLDQERMTGTKVSPTAALQHFAQTVSKSGQNQSLSLVDLTPSSSNTIPRRNSSVNSHSNSAQFHRHPLEQAVHSEPREKDAVRSQETKASYLWRFKGGKLISDNMPSMNAGEPLTQIELNELVSGQRKNIEVTVSMEAKREVHTSGQQSYHKVSASMSVLPNDQSCKSQTSQPSELTIEQQHKKVCGAAAAGQPCYCVLDNKGFPQNAQKSNDPIQSMQRMINQTAGKSQVRKHATSIQGQSSNIKIQTGKSVSATHSAQACQRSDSIIRRSPQDNQKFNASIHFSSNAQANQNSNANVHVSQGNKQCNTTRYAQANQQSSSGLHVSSTAPTGQQSNASFYASRAAQANQQSNPTVTFARNAQANQTSSRVSPTAQTRQQSHASFHVSRNAQVNQQQSNSALHVSRSAKDCQQSNANFHAQANQQSKPSFHVSRNAQARQQPNANLNSQQSEVSRNTRINEQSSRSFKIPQTSQLHQQSKTRAKPLRMTPPGQKSKTNLDISESIEIDRMVAKVEKNISPSRGRGRPRKTETSTVIKSEKTNDNSCSFLASLPPKKQYTSLQQLAKKVIETRQRFDREHIPWKKKILKSLEGVLMKRLRKIEKETGEEADLGSWKSSETETDTTEQDNKK
ncbi:uncharacterized protein LOC144663918 [Oculina patagonica]